MGGLAFIKYNNDGTVKSSYDKFFTEEQLKDFAVYCNAAPGDLILILAGKEERTRKAISELRLYMGERLGLRKPDEFKLLWVTDFPLFEYDEEGNPGTAAMTVEVINVRAHEDIITGTDHINPEKWSPLIYNFRHYYALGEHLGKTFKAEI